MNITGSTVFSITGILFAAQLAFAQSDFDMSQRQLNESLYNPAATGTDFSTTVYSHMRAQWVNMPGAPTTEVVGVNHYIYGLNTAVGLSITGDQIGFTNTYSARLAFAYYIPLFSSSALSFGLSAGLLSRNQNASGALVDDLTDGELHFGNISEAVPDFDFGFEFMSKPKSPIFKLLKIGCVAKHLSGSHDASTYFKSYSTNVWSYISLRFTAGQRIALEPSLSHVYRDKFNRFEGGAIAYFLKTESYDKYWLGAMWRLHGQFSILAGLSLTPNLKIGYSFDHAPSELSRISELGTHELFMSWRIFRSQDKRDSGDGYCPAYRTKGRNSGKNKFLNDVSHRFVIY
jgi:type IX secretion system PorP/SprF family membrane protein